MSESHNDEDSCSSDEVKRSKWREPDIILNIVQILIILAGGLWASYLYFKVERPHRIQFHESTEVIRLGEVANQPGTLKHLIEYNYSIENSGHESADVSYIILSALKSKPLEVDGGDHGVVLNRHTAEGPLKWELIDTYGYRHRDYTPPCAGSDDPPSYTSEYSGEKVEFIVVDGDNLGLGELAMKDKESGLLNVLVEAEPGTMLLALEVRFGINDKDHYRYYDQILLDQP